MRAENYPIKRHQIDKKFICFGDPIYRTASERLRLLALTVEISAEGNSSQ